LATNPHGQLAASQELHVGQHGPQSAGQLLQFSPASQPRWPQQEPGQSEGQLQVSSQGASQPLAPQQAPAYSQGSKRPQLSQSFVPSQVPIVQS